MHIAFIADKTSKFQFNIDFHLDVRFVCLCILQYCAKCHFHIDFFLQLYSIYCLIAFRFMFHFPQIEYTFCTYIRLQEIFQLKREI